MRPAVLACLVVAGGVVAEPVGVLLRLGLRDTAPTAWAGRISADGGRPTSVEPWLLEPDETAADDGTFAFTTDPRPGNPPVQPNGLLLAVDAATLTLEANGRTATADLARLDWGRPVSLLDGAAMLERAPVYATLSDDSGEADFPAAARLAGGELVAVWQVWADGGDRLMVARRRDGLWSPAEPVPGATGDLYRAAITDDGDGAAWIVWSQLVDGDYDLFACRWSGGQFTTPRRIVERRGHDVGVAVARGADGTVHAVWRGDAGESADIFRATCRGGVWSAPETLDGSPGCEWAPAIAAGPGGVWAAWDSYQYGSYDVFCARLDEAPLRRVAVAASPRFEARPTVACAADGGVWFAWEEGPEGWGKDTGYTVPAAFRKASLYGQRTVRVGALRAGQWHEAPAPEAALPEGQRNPLEMPALACDPAGGVWLACRRPLGIPRRDGNRTRSERVWENLLCRLDGDAWTPRVLAGRMGRQDDYAVPLAEDAGVTVLFHTDGRRKPDIRRNMANRIFAAGFGPEPAAAAPELTPRLPAEPATVGAPEAEQIARGRALTVDAGGRRYQLVRGDTHRHTEVSWDGTGDGGLNDAYRYAEDAADLDFFLVTDHNQRTGVDLPYVRHWCYKVAEAMHRPEGFITFFGYERSLGYPNGHRNIIQATAEHPSFPFTGAVDDLQQLYAYARRTQAIVIAHTTGTNHGTDWYAYDRDAEPVIEIFQGCRLSYEYEGCPKGGAPGDQQSENTGYQPRGFLWRAWERDLRLGIISSSDHGSTHYSYAGVWTPDLSRQAILDSLRARRTFGATDNLVVNMRCGERLLGEEFDAADPPRLSIRVDGTAELTRLDVIRDRQFAYTIDPEGSTCELDWQDNDAPPGTHQYYVRVQQADESLAWGSPVWITRR